MGESGLSNVLTQYEKLCPNGFGRVVALNKLSSVWVRTHLLGLDNPVNLSISLAGRKEINRDSVK